MNEIDKIIKLIPETETDFLEDATRISAALDGNEIDLAKAKKEIFTLCYIVFPENDEDMQKWQKNVVNAVLVLHGELPYYWD